MMLWSSAGVASVRHFDSVALTDSLKTSSETDYTINKNYSFIKSIGSQNIVLTTRMKFLKFLLCCLVNVPCEKENVNLKFKFVSHTLKSSTLKTINLTLVMILVLLIKHPINIYKLTINLR